MQVSIVIPTCRRSKLLQKCLDMLAKQSFCKKDYEIIVVCDGPDRDTQSMINIFKAETKNLMRISLFVLPEQRGPAAARNIGWQQARGELIAFTDDDCQPFYDWIANLWIAYQQSHLSIVAFTGAVIVPCKKPVMTDYERNVAQLSTAEFITANCACTKKALKTVGGFDEAFTIAWREDSDLHFKFLQHKIPIINVNTARVCHPVREATWGVSLREQKKSVYNALLYKKHKCFYKKHISNGPIWTYYFTLIALVVAIIAAIKHLPFIAGLFITIWIALVIGFTVKRLQHTSKSTSHIVEMLVTSALIPPLSIYWTLYGSIKYKTLLL